MKKHQICKLAGTSIFVMGLVSTVSTLGKKENLGTHAVVDLPKITAVESWVKEEGGLAYEKYAVDIPVKRELAKVKPVVKKNMDLLATTLEKETLKASLTLKKEKDINWDAKSVENKLPVEISNEDEVYEGFLLDFDGDNGYALVGKDCDEATIIDMQTKGPSPYEGIKSEKFIYSASRGYHYVEGDEVLSVIKENNADEDFLKKDLEKKYNGQSEAGVGHITNPSAYIADRYGSGYTLYESKTLGYIPKYDQSDLSGYYELKKENGSYNTYSEGNCWFVSAYNMVQSLGDKGTLSGVPKQTNTLSYTLKTSEPNLYGKVYDASGNNKTKVVRNNSPVRDCDHQKYAPYATRTWPKAYTVLRKHVDSKYKKTDGGAVYDTSEIVNYTLKNYGYSNTKTFGTICMGVYGDCGFGSIRKGYPFGIATCAVSNSEYGNHVMAGVGYKIYKKTSKWWIFTTTTYRYLYELADGHSYNTTVYFDIGAYTGFGGMILFNGKY